MRVSTLKLYKPFLLLIGKNVKLYIRDDELFDSLNF